MGLVGEALDSGQLAHQRFVIEPFGVGQAGPARTETVKQLRHVQFGTVTVRRAHAGINLRQRADFSPQAEPLGQRLDGGQATQRGLFFGGDKLKANLGRTFGDLRHTGWTVNPPIQLQTSFKKTSPAGAAFKANVKV